MLPFSLYVMLAGVVCLCALVLIKRPGLRHALAAVVMLACAGLLLWYFDATYFFDAAAIAANVAVVLSTLVLFYALLLQLKGYFKQRKRMRLLLLQGTRAESAAVVVGGGEASTEPPISLAEFDGWLARFAESQQARQNETAGETVADATAALETMLEMEAIEEPVTEELVIEEQEPEAPKEESRLDVYNREMDALRALVDDEEYREATDKVFEILSAGYTLPEDELTRLEIVLRLLEERCK